MAATSRISDLRVQPGMTVSGKVVFDVPAGSAAPDVTKVRVAMERQRRVARTRFST